MSERAAAWDALIASTPPGWFVVLQPSYHEARRQWMLYAFDPSERALGRRAATRVGSGRRH